MDGACGMSTRTRKATSKMTIKGRIGFVENSSVIPYILSFVFGSFLLSPVF
jgi:hypothetical protein